MTMQYIREHYDQRFKRGVKVTVRWHGDLYSGVVVGSSGAYVRVRIHQHTKALTFHPNAIKEFLPNEPEAATP